MATFFKAPSANFIQTSLNGAINDSTTSIVLNSTTNLQAPGYVVINRVSASTGAATPNAREVVYFTGISSQTLTGCQRNADGSTARSHADGSIVEAVFTVGMWNDLRNAVDTALTADGVVKAIISPVSIARAEMTNVVIAGTATIATLQPVNITRTVITSIVSAARVESNNYAGAKGHFLWVQSGALTTSLATSTNNSQIPFLRATKNLTLTGVYLGVNSAASLAPLQIDIHNKSTPTGATGPSIFSVLPLVGIGLNEAGATPGTLTLTSLASGQLLYPEIKQPAGAGDLIIQLIGVER